MNNPLTAGQCLMLQPFHIYEEMQDGISLSLVAAVAAVAATNPAAIPRLVAAAIICVNGNIRSNTGK